MFLDDILLTMNRIAEYIDGYDFEHFKKDYNRGSSSKWAKNGVKQLNVMKLGF